MARTKDAVLTPEQKELMEKEYLDFVNPQLIIVHVFVAVAQVFLVVFGVIPYIQLGGKILYRESDIQKILMANYREAYRMKGL